MLNMFRTLIYTSSGACDYSVELPHWSYCSLFDVCWCFGVVELEFVFYSSTITMMHGPINIRLMKDGYPKVHTSSRNLMK